MLKYLYIRLLKYWTLLIRYGLRATFNSFYSFIQRHFFGTQFPKIKEFKVKQILILSGVPFSAMYRYRVDSKFDRLIKKGYSVDIRFYGQINEDAVKYYDIFIFYRVPVDDNLVKLVKKAREWNKMIVFDVDDLIFEKSFVAKRKEVLELPDAERHLYFEGVKRYKKMLKLCDYGITTTQTLATCMNKYLKDVCVDRNFPSDVLRHLHELSYKKKITSDNYDEFSDIKKKIKIGYFSGSKTHDKDFELISDVLLKILKEFPNVQLWLGGYITLPKTFKKYKKQIKRVPFTTWNKFPDVLAQVDINLAPLVDSTFNNAKSELKFIEAGLSRVPTVASSTKQFKWIIENGKNGFVCSNKEEWYESIVKLIKSKKLRERLGKAAYNSCIKRYKPYYSGDHLAKFINTRRTTKVTYVMQSLDISGGNYVILEHANRLLKRGYNVEIIVVNNDTNIDWFDNHVNIIPLISLNLVEYKTDIAVATFWATKYFTDRMNAQSKFYLVQGKEYDFYKNNDILYLDAYRTYVYKDSYKFLVISENLQHWLNYEFGLKSDIIRNGIDCNLFPSRDKEPFLNRKVRVLVEGSLDPDKQAIKNTQEAFEILKAFDFEVWFVTYDGYVPQKYNIDKLFVRYPHNQMYKLYHQTDFLLKTSRVESFSYPPLEMMATGGFSVVAENEGNKEYIKNGYNALTYRIGNIKEAREQIRKLIQDKKLREKLKKGMKSTVNRYSWDKTIDKLDRIFKESIGKKI